MRMNVHRIVVVLGAFTLLALSATALQEMRTVRVESTDGRRAYKTIGVHSDVRLVRQLSDAPCREGRTWGTDQTRIWVDDGCRGEFSYRTRSTSTNPGFGWGNGRQVTVESTDGKRKYVRVDTTGGVRLVRQLSDRPCTYGRTWDYDRNGIWVDRGCRAVFEVGRRGSTGGGVRPGTRVESWAIGNFRSTDGDYRLQVDGDGDATLRTRGGGRSDDYRGTVRGEEIRIAGGTYRIYSYGDGIRMRSPFGSGYITFRRY
jgi:hypothetical protein